MRAAREQRLDVVGRTLAEQVALHPHPVAEERLARVLIDEVP
jgi:hypothetical protein